MDELYASRMQDVPSSFIREILKVTSQTDIISFAGGLPNADYFPTKALQTAANKVFTDEPRSALQYSNTEGCIELRQWIAERYRTQRGLHVSTDNILLTNGSQQGLDLLGKVFINPGDNLVIEAPGYLGALQALSMYQPVFHQVPVDDKGMNITKLDIILNSHHPKMIYTVPDFQNPSGISYTTASREAVIKITTSHDCILIEDSPYSELRFSGSPKPLLYSMAPEKTVLLGSFSKTLSPSLRLGWIVANAEIMQKLVLAKQAADLHTSYLLQRIVLHYLLDNNIDDHISKISTTYQRQKQAMVDAISQFFPHSTRVTNPQGGMFLWAQLDQKILAMDVFKQAIKQKVAFVPGESFYYDDPKYNTMRLNYSCATTEKIHTGIKTLGGIISTM